MALDYPDWQNIPGLASLLTALTAAVNALTSGYGSGVSVIPQQRAMHPDGSLVNIMPGVAGKTNVLTFCLCAWQSVSDVQLRGYIDIGISLDNGNSYFIVVLTPETPTVPISFGYGAAASAQNQPIIVTATAADGAPVADSSISVTSLYFRV